MIFHLNCSIEDLVATDTLELEELFSRLLEADRMGRHLFISKRALCTWAVECLDLSGRDRAHLASIREQYTTRRSLLKYCFAYVDVLLGGNSVRFDGKQMFSVGHRLLLNGEYLSRSASFVVEDSDSDARLYEHIFREVEKLTRVPSYSFDPVHGGGSGIARVFDSEIERNRVVVCVVDNDKLAPTARISASARAVLSNYMRRNLEVERDEKTFIGLAVATIGREIENYIPLSALRIIPRYRTYPHYRMMERIFEREKGELYGNGFWLYFDVKWGLCGGNVQEMRMRESVSEVISWICQKMGCERQDLENVRMRGFRDGVVDAFLECNEALREFHKCVRAEAWRSIYCEYFEKILWFFVAPRPERT